MVDLAPAAAAAVAGLAVAEPEPESELVPELCLARGSARKIGVRVSRLAPALALYSPALVPEAQPQLRSEQENQSAVAAAIAAAAGPAAGPAAGLTQIPVHASASPSLTLNIWSPAGFPSTRDLLPVMVFIHGGAFREGSSASPLCVYIYPC